MNPEWRFLLDTVLRWLPYIAVIVIVPAMIVIVRCVFKGACRNGPIYRSGSRTDEDAWMGEKTGSRPSLGQHQSLPNLLGSADVFKTVSLHDQKSHDGAGAQSPADRGICTMCMRIFTLNNLAHMLPCQHRFHESCVNQWFSHKKYCPQCIRPSSVSALQV